jgi:tetratricopeptide (TPR) repeat protein
MNYFGLGVLMRALIKRVKLWFGDPPSNDLSTISPRDEYLALVAKADAARDRRDWAVAADAYEAALAVRPNEAPIWVQLGNMSKDSNDFARALYAYKRALDLRPNDADTNLQIGHLHKRAGDKAKALASYALATFRRKIGVFGSTFNGLRPSKDRRTAGGHF